MSIKQCTTYEIGGRFFFDVENNTLTDRERYGKKTIELGLNEARLLELLLTNKDRTVSREEILDVVWHKRGLVVDEASINQVISQLRKTLYDDAKEQKIIKTIPTKGYSLSPGVQVTIIPPDSPTSNITPGLTVRRTLPQLIVSFVLAVSLNYAIMLKAPSPITYPYLTIEHVTLEQRNEIPNPLIIHLINECIINITQQATPAYDKIIISNNDKSFSLIALRANHTKTFQIVLNDKIRIRENKCHAP